MTSSTYQYFEDWPENTDIAWWNEGRKQLNAVIHSVNRWTLEGCPAEQAATLLRHIEMGAQTFASQDGGERWLACLQGMRAYVEGKSSSTERTT